MNVDELAQRYPDAKIDPDVLFADDGDLITSAGTAAGVDACLRLVRRELERGDDAAQVAVDAASVACPQPVGADRPRR